MPYKREILTGVGGDITRNPREWVETLKGSRMTYGRGGDAGRKQFKIMSLGGEDSGEYGKI